MPLPSTNALPIAESASVMAVKNVIKNLCRPAKIGDWIRPIGSAICDLGIVTAYF
jgi:hypothetical protein